jgi:hypothetical protein
MMCGIFEWLYMGKESSVDAGSAVLFHREIINAIPKQSMRTAVSECAIWNADVKV